MAKTRSERILDIAPRSKISSLIKEIKSELLNLTDKELDELGTAIDFEIWDRQERSLDEDV